MKTPKSFALGFVAITSVSIVVAAIVSCRSVLATRRTRDSPLPIDSGEGPQFGTYRERVSNSRGWKLTQYTAVVIFGASDCDDAHPRDPKFNHTLRLISPYFQGRFTNGHVFGEYLAQGTLTNHKVTQLNYAYGEATVNNGLVSVDAPDTQSQTDAYIADVSHHSVDRGSKDPRVLHCIWIAINDVIQIWTDMVANDQFQMSDVTGIQAAFVLAQDRVKAEVTEVVNQVQNLINNAQVNSVPSDYLVMLLPPLEIVPNLYYQSLEKAQRNSTRAAFYLDYVGRLTNEYNQGLIEKTEALAKKTSAADHGARRSGFLKIFDTVTLWRDIHQSPAKYGFVNVVDACWNSTTGAICEKPAEYQYWDTLHPTTAMHERIAQEITVACNP